MSEMEGSASSSPRSSTPPFRPAGSLPLEAHRHPPLLLQCSERHPQAAAAGPSLQGGPDPAVGEGGGVRGNPSGWCEGEGRGGWTCHGAGVKEHGLNLIAQIWPKRARAKFGCHNECIKLGGLIHVNSCTFYAVVTVWRVASGTYALSLRCVLGCMSDFFLQRLACACTSRRTRTRMGRKACAHTTHSLIHPVICSAPGPALAPGRTSPPISWRGCSSTPTAGYCTSSIKTQVAY